MKDEIIKRNQKTLSLSIQLASLPKIDLDDYQLVQSRIGDYFNLAMEAGSKPSLAGLALALGVERNTILNWASGVNRPSTYGDLILRAKTIIEEQLETGIVNGEVNPVGAIFVMKNNFGYKDIQDVKIAPETGKTQAELEQEYIKALPDEKKGS